MANGSLSLTVLLVASLCVMPYSAFFVNPRDGDSQLGSALKFFRNGFSLDRRPSAAFRRFSESFFPEDDEDVVVNPQDEIPLETFEEDFLNEDLGSLNARTFIENEPSTIVQVPGNRAAAESFDRRLREESGKVPDLVEEESERENLSNIPIDESVVLNDENEAENADNISDVDSNERQTPEVTLVEPDIEDLRGDEMSVFDQDELVNDNEEAVTSDSRVPLEENSEIVSLEDDDDESLVPEGEIIEEVFDDEAVADESEDIDTAPSFLDVDRNSESFEDELLENTTNMDEEQDNANLLDFDENVSGEQTVDELPMIDEIESDEEEPLILLEDDQFDQDEGVQDEPIVQDRVPIDEGFEEEDFSQGLNEDPLTNISSESDDSEDIQGNADVPNLESVVDSIMDELEENEENITLVNSMAANENSTNEDEGFQFPSLSSISDFFTGR